MTIEARVGEGEREVGARGDHRVVTLSREYDTTVEDLWDACTSAERIPRWFLPVTGELRVGGRYQLEGNAGGVIEQCEPPNRFRATWEFGGGMSWIEVRIEAVGDGAGARLVLEHTVPTDGHWEEYGPGAVGVGWDLGLLGLALHVAAGPSVMVDRDEVAAWMGSPDGLGFVRDCTAAWGEASVAAGDDVEWARAAAARTSEAYAPAASQTDTSAS